MLNIGWSSRDFTPTRPAMLQGQMHVRVARSALDPLTLTACAMESPKTKDAAIFISIDLAYVTEALLSAVRAGFRKSYPTVQGMKIIINATHTHTSLTFDGDFYPHPGGDVMSQQDCLDLIASNAIEAATEAWKNRKPMRIGRAFGHAVVAHNRYAGYLGGRGQMYGATNCKEFDHIGGYEDHSMDMLFTWHPDGTLGGMILSIPCPSQVDEHLTQFSADYWHEVRNELRARLGAKLPVLALCGAAGDQSPHFLIYGREEAEMRKRRGVSERQEIALRVAATVERALICPTPIEDADTKFFHVGVIKKLTALKVTKDHSDWAADQLKGWKPDDTSWYPVNLKRVIKAWKKKIVGAPFPAELHVVRIGDVALASNPFELFLDYGLQMKARSPAQQTVLVQLAGRGMYLPTSRALGGGGYGANPVVAEVGPEGGAELVEWTLKSIEKMFRK